MYSILCQCQNGKILKEKIICKIKLVSKDIILMYDTRNKSWFHAANPSNSGLAVLFQCGAL